MDFQNNRSSIVQKDWKFRIVVPMSYISKNKIRNKSFCKVWSARKCILKVDFVSPDLLSASSYGRNKFRIEFWSQCHIFRGWTLVDIERTLYKVICIDTLAGGTRYS